MDDSKTGAAPRSLKPLSLAIFGGLAAVPQYVQAQSTPAAAQPLEEIIVTSSLIPQSRRQIGTAVSSIDFEEIQLRGYTDVSDVLRTQTGIGVSNSGGAGKSTSVRIRGEEAYRTMLIIDGVKAVDPSGAQVAPNFDSLLTTSDLQRVEVLRGPQGFMYGADAGGVVNVMTKRGADGFGGRVGLELGDDETRKVDAAVSGGNDSGDYYVSVVDFETDGFNSRTDDTLLADNDGAENTTVHTKLGWNVSDNVRLQLVARDIDAEAQYDNCFGGPPAFAFSNDCLSTTDQTTYKLSADITSGDFTNTFGYSNVDISSDNLTAGVSSFASEGELGRFEYTGSYKPSDMLGIVFGVDLQQEAFTDSDGRRSRDQDAYYAEYQGAFNDSFFVSLGARYDDNEDFGTHTSSRLSLAYAQDLSSERSLKYRASVGTGFRAPSLYEIAYNSGPSSFPPASGTELKEETSRGYDIGVDYDAARLHFEVTYFDQKIEDAIEFDLTTFSGYLQVPGTSTSKGIEIGATVPFGERWELLANWTNNDAKTAAGTQRRRRPENLGNFGVLYRPADQGLSFIANVRVSRDAIDEVFGVGIVPLPDYEVLDLSVNWDISERVQVFGRLQNATDENYYEVLGYNSAERSVYGGVRLIF
jgi:vitamin B12 transporter